MQFLFLTLDEDHLVDVAIEAAIVLLLFDAENIGGALDAGEEVYAVIGCRGTATAPRRGAPP